MLVVKKLRLFAIFIANGEFRRFGFRPFLRRRKLSRTYIALYGGLPLR
jgi:hypothetical protein